MNTTSRAGIDALRSALAAAAPLCLAVALLAWCASALAYAPLIVSLSRVASQADLVVTGRLKEGSVVRMASNPRGRFSRATLLITRVERGGFAARECTVWFRDQAVPVVGGNIQWENSWGRTVTIKRRVADKAAVHLYEINTGPYKMAAGDLRSDHVWFLKSGRNLPGLPPAARAWCIDNAQYVAPLNLKAKYLAAPMVDEFPL